MMAGEIRINPPKMFNPTKRLALLVSHKLNVGYLRELAGEQREFVSAMDKLSTSTEGNIRMYQMEAALRRGILPMDDEVVGYIGTQMKCSYEIALEEASRVYEKVLRVYQLKMAYAEGAEILAGDSTLSHAGRTAAQKLFDILGRVGVDYFKEGRHEALSIKYDYIKRIYPDIEDPEEVYGVLSFYRNIADKDTLTYMFIIAGGNGRPDGVGVFPYDGLIERLDQIAGRKVLFVLAAHSGELAKRIAVRPSSANYLAITSQLPGDHHDNTFDEDGLFEEVLFYHIKPPKPLSSLGYPGRSLYDALKEKIDSYQGFGGPSLMMPSEKITMRRFSEMEKEGFNWSESLRTAASRFPFDVIL